MSEQAITAKGKGKRFPWMIIVIVVALAACAAAGYSWWMLHKQPAQGEVNKPQPPAAPVFMPLDTFTVNLQTPNNDPDRVLYIGLTLRVPDEATRTQFSSYLPEVRSRLLMLLSRQTPDQLASEEGKRQLIAQIKETLRPTLVPGQPDQKVTDVLFTAFILR